MQSALRSLLCWLLLLTAAAPLRAEDTAIAATPGGMPLHGILTAGGARFEYRADGAKLTLTLLQDSLALYYADGTPLATLKTGDKLLISGEFFTPGIGGVANARGFTLAPALRLTIKNIGAGPISFFDTTTAKLLLVPAGAVVNLEVQPQLLRNADNLLATLKPGQLVRIGKAAVVTRIAGSLAILAYENLALGPPSMQISLVPDSSLLLTAGTLSLKDGRLVLTGSTAAVLVLSGVVVVISPAGKFDLIPGQGSTAGAGGFSAPTSGQKPPPGLLFAIVRVVGVTGQLPAVPGGGAQPSGPARLRLRIPRYDPTRLPGSFYLITIVGAERDQLSGVH